MPKSRPRPGPSKVRNDDDDDDDECTISAFFAHTAGSCVAVMGPLLGWCALLAHDVARGVKVTRPLQFKLHKPSRLDQTS